MRKGSKALLIISGIFALLEAGFYAFYLLLVNVAYGIAAIAGGSSFIANAMNATSEELENIIPPIVSALVGYGLGYIIVSILCGGAIILFILSAVFSFLGTKRKLGLNIVSLVLTLLCFGPVLVITPYSLLYGLVMLLFFWLFIILLFTPVTWIFLAIVLVGALGWTFIICSIIGNILAIVSKQKEKKIIIDDPYIEVVE